MIAADILLDGLFAAIAAIGFGAVSDPADAGFSPYRPAGGHGARPAVLLDALLFGRHRHGLAVRLDQHRVRQPVAGARYPLPMTALYIPALLPMVPGIYAYKTVFSLIMFLQSLNDPGEGLQFMQQFFLNATVSLSVIALLAAGATLPIFVFNHQAFSLTRRRKHTDK